MPDRISDLLGSYREAITEILGDKLVRIILFGSYARGDFNQNSDIDLMILADASQDEISDYTSLIYDITYDFEEAYGTEINPCVQSIHTFEKWKRTYPFFMNVETDGVNV